MTTFLGLKDGGFAESERIDENSPMPQKIEVAAPGDKGGRRCGIERRTFSYTCHIPERRSGLERRSGADRRRNKRINLFPEIEAGQAMGSLQMRPR
jgi:hypothetical protein